MKGINMTSLEVFRLVQDLLNSLPLNTIFVNTLFLFIIVTTLIQVLTKFNPWVAILNKIGQLINADSDKRIAEIDAKLDRHIREDQECKAREWRRDILAFSDQEIRSGNHTKEAFDNILDSIEGYEEFVRENKIVNEKAVRAIKHLRNRYDEHMEKGDFLQEGFDD